MQALRIAQACEVLRISHTASTKEITKAYKDCMVCDDDELLLLFPAQLGRASQTM